MGYMLGKDLLVNSESSSHIPSYLLELFANNTISYNVSKKKVKSDYEILDSSYIERILNSLLNVINSSPKKQDDDKPQEWYV
ncbi:MAG: hypothetical protein GOU97_04095 [Nanoarchaeota archaeon]|nr:hypothetical protein [Nanoarchaeota archaeon]